MHCSFINLNSMESWPEGWASKTHRSDQLLRNFSTSLIRWLTRLRPRRRLERWSRNLLKRWRPLRQFSSKTGSSASSATNIQRSWVWKNFSFNNQCTFLCLYAWVLTKIMMSFKSVFFLVEELYSFKTIF